MTWDWLLSSAFSSPVKDSSMLEVLDLNKQVPKETYEKVFSEMETRLGAAQRAARAAGVPVVIVFEGWHAAGKGKIINRLVQSLDPRGFKVYAVGEATDLERFYPWMWRFWNLLPGAGDIVILDHSWYCRVLSERMENTKDQTPWREAYDGIREFERQLTESGVVLVKFWLHISKQEQKKRFEALESNEAMSWRVGKEEWRQNKKYRAWLAATEEMLERTDTANAPWTLVEATYERYVRVRVVERVLQAVEGELDRRASSPPAERKPMAEPVDWPPPHKTILDRVDLSLSRSRDQYEKDLDDLQERLLHLEYRLYKARIPALVAYEGWDAAGKGGNIRRLTQGLDPRGYEVIPIAAPTAEEVARHYLWRFWRRVPKAGHIGIFDRTWYGRVLVERVEGFCTEAEWKRAYQEINEFERQLTESGTVVVKFWLQIDREEQLRRFQDRQNTAAKQWKITQEDWRNRDKWKQYSVCVAEMIERTSTTYAPWTILEANCKLYARIKALRTVADAIENALNR